MFTFLKSYSIKFLLVGYLFLISLTAGIILTDSSLLKYQFNIIDKSDAANKKQQIIVDLIEVAQTRVQFTHKMLSTDDVFEKDEIWQEITALAEKFILKNQELATLNLDKRERSILKEQQEDYPIVLQKVREIKEYAFEETLEANTKARNIIIFEIVPVQEAIVERFMTILKKIQEDVSYSRESALKQYSSNEFYRQILIFVAFFASFGVLIWVVYRMSKIEKKLHSISVIDGLTGIPNRRKFDETIDIEWKHALRSKSPLSLLLIDIDYFKKYNDFYGHQEGDRCLVKSAKLIKESARRDTDLAARYGGEEFALVLPNTTADHAMEIALALIDKVNIQKIPHENSEITNHLTFSIGVATFDIENEIDTPEELIEKADKALYQSKGKGRNQASFIS